MTNLAALSVGTRLGEDYRIERVLGAGGFGITYLAEETPLARMVTIKEYFPVDFAIRDAQHAAQPRSIDCTGDYQWGLDRFIDEARTLARFDHPNIVRVYRFFRENNSGFMVLQYEEGRSFKAWLKALGRAPRQHELDRLVPQLLDALALIHASDFLHRDIAPDNIIIRTDGSPVLIDFGSARSDIAQHSRTVSALVKPGYSPYEQYATTGRQQGPWTDIYSLGATLYQAVTGKRPPDSPSRMVADEFIPARDAAISSYRPGFLAAIDAALALDVTARPRSIDEWRKQLLAPAAKSDAAAEDDATADKPDAVAKTKGPVKAPSADNGAAKSKVRAKTKLKDAPDSPAQAVGNKKPAKPVEAAPRSMPRSTPRRSTSEGRVAAIFRDWRARRAAATPPAEAAQSPAKPAEPAPAAADASPKANLPMPVERRIPPRPARPRRKWNWRPLAVKGAIGLAVASLAVAYQETLPRIERQGASTVSSGTLANAQIAQIKGHKGAVDGVVHTPDGRFIVTTGADGTLKIWQATSRALVHTIDLDAGAATAIAASDKRVVTGHKAGRIALWDLESGSRVAEFKRNDADIWAVAFTGSPDRILAGDHDWKLALLDARTPVLPVHVFDGHESAVRAVAFSAPRNLIATGGDDRTVRLWNAETLEMVRAHRGHQDHITAVAFAPDGRHLASSDLAGSVRIWSITTRRLHRSIRAHKGGTTSLAYSNDGNWLATAGRDGLVRIWDTRRQRPPRTFVGHAGEVRALSFAPDDTTLASAGADGVVRVWSTGFVDGRGS